MRTQGESRRRGQSSASIEPLETRTLMAGDVVLEWNAIAVETTKTLVPALTTQRQTRMMAMVHGAVFDAVNSVERDYDPYLVKVGTPRWASADAAAAVAAHDVLVGLVPAKQAAFDDSLAASLAAIPDGPAEDEGAAVGRAVAAAMLAHRQDDGFNAVVPYTPGTEPDDWQPTPPAFAPPVTPQLATTDPFALRAPDQFRAAPPPPITSAAFTQAFDEAKALGAVNSTTRTAEQTEIARYWVGPAGTVLPPGQWNRIARTVATARGNSMPENARLFALLNFGMADAQISCWDTKYTYNFVRPITAIRNAANDGNDDTVADPAWTPLITTPAHPSYTSGHSTVSAAAATILGTFFGDDSIAFEDTAELSAGGATITRSFGGFWEAAEEAASSRLYAGIHWSFDNEVGLEAGRDVGRFVSDGLLRPRGGGNDPGAAEAHGTPFLDSGGGSFDDTGDRDDAGDLQSLLSTDQPLTS